MAKATLLRGFLDRVGLPVAKRTNTWSVIKVEKLLNDLGIKDYEFDYEPKVVRIAKNEDLMRILLHLMPSEVSKDTSLTITQADGTQRFRIGSWQFEAKS